MSTFTESLIRYVLVPVAAAIFGVAFKGWIENRRFVPLLSIRNIAGLWNGTLQYTHNNVSVEITCKIYRRGWLFNRRLVKGTLTFSNREMDIRGGFYLSDHLMLDYTSSEPHVRDVGSVLLKLDSEGRNLQGHLIGYFDDTFSAHVVFDDTGLGDTLVEVGPGRWVS